VSTARKRLSGRLSRGRRGMVLTTKIGEVWTIESDDAPDHLIGSTVIVEGTVAGIDRLRADWVGAQDQPS
jgi:hypothetical protein